MPADASPFSRVVTEAVAGSSNEKEVAADVVDAGGLAVKRLLPVVLPEPNGSWIRTCAAERFRTPLNLLPRQRIDRAPGAAPAETSVAGEVGQSAVSCSSVGWPAQCRNSVEPVSDTSRRCN